MISFFKKIFFASGLLLIVVGCSSCKKFVQVEPPITSVNEENIYKTDATAISVLTGIYAQIANTSMFSGRSGTSLLAGLSADELTLSSSVTDEGMLAYYKNKLRTNSNENYGTELWSGGLFFYIFTCNAAIEGVGKSGSLTASVRKQLLGEAKFMRAFFNFYLVNYYGDAPLILTTNPSVNTVISRSPKQDVYKQIVADLKEAQQLLSENYLNKNLQSSGSAERLRPTKWAATALLARTYLYMTEYANAESEASKIINNTSLFSLPILNNVFLKNSTESIWQIQPVQVGRNTEDAFVFILPPTGPNASANPVYLSSQILNAFESNDKRRKGGNWVDSVIVGGKTYFFPAKYKATTTSGAPTEYLMIFRLAEQYLIRSEARAYLNNIQGAKNDLNAIRGRAGLLNTGANDQASLLTTILQERQYELFTEMGHRWLDLKRTGKVDEVMSVVTPLKANGAAWRSFQQLYPIPFRDIEMNPNLVQNNGY